MLNLKPTVTFSNRDISTSNSLPNLLTENIIIKKIDSILEIEACIILSKKPEIKCVLGELEKKDFSDYIEGLVIIKNGKVIGWRTYYNADDGIINGILYAIDPEYWGTGVSKTLLLKWIELLKKENKKRIEVMVNSKNTHSLNRLKSVGFSIDYIEQGSSSITYLSLNL